MSQFTSQWYESWKAKQEAMQKVVFVAVKAQQTKAKKVPKNKGPLEKVIQQDIAKFLSCLRHCYYVWHRTDQRTTCAVGTPDFIGVWHGIPFAIEVKRLGGKPTGAQLDHLTKAKEAGMRALVAYSLEGVKEFFATFCVDKPA